MIKYTQYMIKRHVGRTAAALLAAAVLLSGLGAAADLARDLRQRSESPQERPGLVRQAPHYQGPTWCLVEGVGQPEACRGGLPDCLQEDGSGPGVWCWFTSDGKLWFQDGSEDNDQQKLP